MSAEAASSSSSSANDESVTIPPVPAGHTQLYVKNLAFTTTEDGLNTFVNEKVGARPHSVNIVTTRRPGKFQGRSRGFGFITIITERSNDAINKLNGQELDGRELSVVEAKPRDPDAPRPKRQPRIPRANKDNNANNNDNNNNQTEEGDSKRAKPERKSFPNATQLYVNNLSFDTTPEQLADLFKSKTGQSPLDVDIVKSRFGKYKDRSRGFGFVFVSDSVLEAAKSLDGSLFAERPIGVQMAKPQDDSSAASSSSSAAPSSSRGGRRRRGGAGGGRQSSANTDGTSSGEAGSDEAPNNRRRRPRGGGAGSKAEEGESVSSSGGAPPRGRGGRRRGRGGRRGGANNNNDAAGSGETNNA